MALVDKDGELTDVAMPAEGTQAHVTLLVAEFLAKANSLSSIKDVVIYIEQSREYYGRFWRKSARQSGSEYELASIALHQLRSLQLITINGDWVHPLPALARFAIDIDAVAKAANSLSF
jgi:uncharacterized protein (TIGR02678 family)